VAGGCSEKAKHIGTSGVGRRTNKKGLGGSGKLKRPHQSAWREGGKGGGGTAMIKNMVFDVEQSGRDRRTDEGGEAGELSGWGNDEKGWGPVKESGLRKGDWLECCDGQNRGGGLLRQGPNCFVFFLGFLRPHRRATTTPQPATRHSLPTGRSGTPQPPPDPPPARPAPNDKPPTDARPPTITPTPETDFLGLGFLGGFWGFVGFGSCWGVGGFFCCVYFF